LRRVRGEEEKEKESNRYALSLILSLNPRYKNIQKLRREEKEKILKR
jgi:hypothetical protein